MLRRGKLELSNEKKTIYYNREYRYLKRNILEALLFLVIAVVPFEYFLFQNYSWYTKKISEFAAGLLQSFFGVTAGLGENHFIYENAPIYYVDTQGRSPNFMCCLFVLLLTLGALVVTTQKFLQMKPLMIYLTILCAILLVSVIYFIFQKDDFPYSLAYYANCYLSQEIIVLGMIGIVLGLAIALLPNVYIIDLITFWGTMAYGIVYGTVRYFVYIVFLYWATNLFMAPLYFMMGIFLDFLYVMAIYALFAKKVSDTYNRGRGQSRWNWS